MTPLGAGEIHPLTRFVDAVNFPNFPGAIGDLPNEVSVGTIVVEMLPASAFG